MPLSNVWQIRVLRLDGTTVTDDLPHQTSKYSVFGFQGGLNAHQATIGQATIPLLPPGSPEGVGASFATANLDVLQRIEIYTRGSIGQGNPLWSGVITKLPKNHNNYTITAEDSLEVLRRAIRFIPFSTSQTADLIIKNLATQFYSVGYADNLNGLGARHVSGSSSATWIASVSEGMSGASIINPITTNTLHPEIGTQSLSCVPYANAQISFDFIVSGWTGPNGVVVGGYIGTSRTDTSPGSGDGGPGLTFNASFYMTNGQPYVQLGLGNDTIPFLQTFNSVSSAPIPITPGTIRGQLSLVTKGVDSGGNVPAELLYNGQSVGCLTIGSNDANLVIPSSNFPTTGTIGIHVSSASNASVFVSNYVAITSSSIIKLNSIASPTITNNPPQHNFSQANCLDILNVACNQEGWGYRKTPKAGWGNDLLDVGTTYTPGAGGTPTIGTATGIRFAEGDNCESPQLEDNAELPAATLNANGAGGSGNGPKYLAYNIPALTKYGLFGRTVNLPDYAGFGALRRAGQLAVQNSGSPGQSKTIIVNDKLTEGLWRELDTAILHYPTVGIIEQAVTILGYEIDEGSNSKTVHLDQYPATSAPVAASRLRSQLDDALGGASKSTGTTGNGLLTVDLQLQQGISSADSAHNVRAVLGVQKDGKNGLRILNADGTVAQITALPYSLDFTT